MTSMKKSTFNKCLYEIKILSLIVHHFCHLQLQQRKQGQTNTIHVSSFWRWSTNLSWKAIGWTWIQDGRCTIVEEISRFCLWQVWSKFFLIFTHHFHVKYKLGLGLCKSELPIFKRFFFHYFNSFYFSYDCFTSHSKPKRYALSLVRL